MAQECVPFLGNPDTCFEVFDANDEVFTVPSQNVTQQVIAPQVGQLLSTFLSPSPKVCADLMVKFFCQYMGKCVRSVEIPGAALWSRPCQQLCTQFVNTCAPVFDNAGLGDMLRSELANCSAVDPMLGLPLYPDVGTLYNLGGGVTEFVPCEQFSNATMDSYRPPCNTPLVFVESYWEAGQEPGCAPPCPAMTYTESEWDSAILMIQIVAIAGFVSTLLAGITQLFFAKHRRYPGSAALFVTLCVNQISLAFMIASSRSVWCHNDYTNAGPDTDDSFCLWQGFWLLFWALAGVFWWATVAFNLFWIIVLHRKPTRGHHIAAHIICWSIPMLLTIITISFEHIAYVDTAFWCFIDRGDDGWWQYGIFYIPVGAIILWVLAMISAVLWEMRKTQGQNKVYKYFRVVLFVFVWLYIYVFAFAYLGYNTEREDEFTEAALAYGGCIFYGGTEDTCEVAARTPIGFWMIFGFNVCGEGIFIALLWGTTIEVMRFWFDRCRNLKEGRSFFDGMASQTETSYGGSTQ